MPPESLLGVCGCCARGPLPALEGKPQNWLALTPSITKSRSRRRTFLNPSWIVKPWGSEGSCSLQQISYYCPVFYGSL